MTDNEKAELAELRELWACGEATKKQMLRCLDLQRKERAEHVAN